jgi:hypothetical protein
MVDRLVPSCDPKEWAQAFCRLNPTADEATMIAWFGNALKSGFDEHARRISMVPTFAPGMSGQPFR